MNSFLRRSLVGVVLIALARADGAEQISEDRELKEIDLTPWSCVNRAEGSGRSPDTAERNRLKNRFAADLSKLAVTPFDTNSLMKHVANFDAETKSKRRKDLSADQKRRLEILEAPLVSLTGYLVLAYPGPAESTNCGSVDFHDWHLEMFDQPSDHPPQPGDPTPIIVEITPRTQNAIFRDGIRVQELAAFFRRPDVTYESTGHPAQKVRVTGYVLWDDEHNDNTKDVGATIRSIARNRYHNPWRATAWEIHPVIKIERADAAPSVSAPSPQVAPTVPAVPSATAPQQFVTILRAVKIKIPYGETILQRGTRLPIVSRDATTVTVRYLDSTYPIPIASTDLR
ncbi:MAG TPA: hypothetical protein VE031_11920 [Chthoniobacterales bacterium]|nr:hypothetical protein [Chthoniobacterales bacterium]